MKNLINFYIKFNAESDYNMVFINQMEHYLRLKSGGHSMQWVNSPCDMCKNMRKEKVNKYHPTCNAFSEGIPYDFLRENNVIKIKECNNGIGYEKKQ